MPQWVWGDGCVRARGRGWPCGWPRGRVGDDGLVATGTAFVKTKVFSTRRKHIRDTALLLYYPLVYKTPAHNATSARSRLRARYLRTGSFISPDSAFAKAHHMVLQAVVPKQHRRGYVFCPGQTLSLYSAMCLPGHIKDFSKAIWIFTSECTRFRINQQHPTALPTD